MARSEALLRITKTLLGRRNELRKRLGVDISSLSNTNGTASGDSADVAFEHTGEELASHLAELEARELAMVELALRRIKQGKYGVCDGCSTKIPVARLDALPYSVLCIKCQRESEAHPSWQTDRLASEWDKIAEADSSFDKEFRLSELEIDFSK